MDQGRSKIRYFELGLIVAVVAVLALMLRPKPESKPETPDLAAVRQDLMAVVTPVWGSGDSALTLSCSPDRVLDVNLHLNPGTPARKFWLTQVVNFVCANQSGAVLRPGMLDASEGGAVNSASSGAAVPVARSSDPVVNAELNKRGNDLLAQTLGPEKALFLVESADGPVSVDEPGEGELAYTGPRGKKRAPESDAGEPAMEKVRFDDRAESDRPRGGGESMVSRRQRAPQCPPPPSLNVSGPQPGTVQATPARYRSFLILSSSVPTSQDDTLRSQLFPLVMNSPILVIHLQSHGAAPPKI